MRLKNKNSPNKIFYLGYFCSIIQLLIKLLKRKMNIKYKLVVEDFKILDCGTKVYRIQALKNFGSVRAGNLGGYIEGEHNLSVNNSCWVFDSATVYNSAYLANKAVVFDKAQVFNKATVCGSSRVYGNSKVFDSAKVYGNSQIYGSAQVYNKAQIYGSAQVYNKAQIYELAHVFDNSQVCDSAHVFGNSQVFGDSVICKSDKMVKINIKQITPIHKHKYVWVEDVTLKIITMAMAKRNMHQLCRRGIFKCNCGLIHYGKAKTGL